MKEDNNIEDLFRSSFDHFEAVPPSAVKDAIDRKIGKSSRKGIWWISGLLVVLGTASLLFFFNYSSEKQVAGTSGNQLASTETPANGSASKTTHSAYHSSTHQSSTSSSGQSDDQNTVSSKQTSGTKKRNGSNKNQASSSSETDGNGTKSMTSNSGNKKNNSSKANSSKAKKASGKKSAGKKSSGKKTSGKKNNSGTPGSGDLSALPNLTDLGNTPIDCGGKGNGNSEPENPDGANNSGNSEADPVVPDPKENPVTPQTTDSTKKEDPKKVLPPKPKNEGGNWLASVYAGPSFGINSKSNDELRSVSEKPSFQFSAEINRSFVAGYGLSTGFGFNQRQETYNYTNQQILDSAIVVTLDSIPVYGNPNEPDSITGYTDSTYYFDDTLSTDFNQLNRIQTIGIPLYFTKHFSFTDQWGLLVNAGALFQFHKVSLGQTDGIPAPTINNFSMNLTGRFHLTYTWNQFMFSAGVSNGWELKQAIIYEGLDRKRYFITPQLGFHYRF